MIANVNSHLKQMTSFAQIPKNSYVWKVLARKNRLDMQLYEYVETLFKEQLEIVDLYEDQKPKAMAF